VKRPLNLARRPFRNERLPTLVLLVACVLLLGLSVRHALAGLDLLPERTAEVDGELVALEEEVTQLRAEFDQLRTREAAPQAIKEWGVVRDLVDRRAFSWSELLGRLEAVVPAGVRLLSIAPESSREGIAVTIRAVGRTVEDGLEFLQALQDGKDFRDPFLTSVGESNRGIDLEYTMTYAPRPAGSGEKKR
jgi:Tfp pilus assembly protein PilN